MLDTTRALADIARQVRAYRSADGLSLQQLATRSGVAASTIHKVESRQMVPTVVVLLKIAKGLGRRPEELIRDDLHAGLGDGAEPAIPADGSARGPADAMPGRGGREAVAARAAPSSRGRARRDVAAWEFEISPERPLPVLDLDPLQRAVFLVQQGGITLSTGSERADLRTGDCIAIEGGRIESTVAPDDSARVLLIVTPSARLVRLLDEPGSEEAAV